MDTFNVVMGLCAVAALLASLAIIGIFMIFAAAQIEADVPPNEPANYQPMAMLTHRAVPPPTGASHVDRHDVPVAA